MKILFVCNNAFNPGNGLSVSIRHTMKGLRELGVDARLMAVRNPDPEGPQPDFPLAHFKFPIFEPIIRANGFCYAKIDRKVIREAVGWADVVHFQEAFFLENAVRRIARKLGKPCTATFHLYPHNVTANLGIGRWEWANRLAIRYWNWCVFDHCTDIQCPSRAAERYLRESGVQARTHVISNGINLPAEPEKVLPLDGDGDIDLLCIGRLSREKSQETLLEAMRFSRYAHRIRIHFAGRGTREKAYRRKAEELLSEGILKHRPTFGFYDAEGLADLTRRSWLYIHCAWVEVEGLSCLEATARGIVPVIGEGPLIGTTDFALTPESIYPTGDSRALAGRIDWWIEHPDERNRFAALQAEAARKYDIRKSMQALVAMFEQAAATPVQ